MKTLIALLAGIALAGGAGFFAWKQKQALERTAAELGTTRDALAKAQGELGKANETLRGLAEVLKEMEANAEKMKSERDTAVAFLMQEKAHGERLRAELMLAQQQLAYVRARAAPPAALVQPREPMVIRALPAPVPQSVGAPIQARPAAQ